MKAERNSKKLLVTPKTIRILETVGEQIRLARLRRKISVEMVAARANVSRQTVWKVEKGSPSVAMGIYAKVLGAIGMQEDLLLIAKDDEIGRILQDAELDKRKR